MLTAKQKKQALFAMKNFRANAISLSADQNIKRGYYHAKKNISVRTFIIGFLFSLFLVSAGVVVLFSSNTSLFISLNVINFVALFLLWVYMTKYLVTPINTVKRSIEEVTAGNLGVSIPEFGNNCAGRLIPGINSFPAILRRWCVRSGVIANRHDLIGPTLGT